MICSPFARKIIIRRQRYLAQYANWGHHQDRIGIWKCWFLRKGKTGVPGEKPLGARMRTKNKLNPHMTASPVIEVTLVEGKCSHHCPIPGPSCIKQLEIKWEFLEPFPVFQKIFLHAIMDKSAEGGLKSIGNTTTVRKNPQ